MSSRADRACRIVRKDADGLRVLGTGALARFSGRSWLITNSHVANKGCPVADQTFFYVPNGHSAGFPAALARDDQACDLAVFSVETDLSQDDEFREQPKIGDEVFTIGFPDALGTTGNARVASGTVASLIFGVCNGMEFLITDDSRAYPCFTATGLNPVAGSSGSPVFDRQGHFVGYTKGFLDGGLALCFSGKNIIETLKQLSASGLARR